MQKIISILSMILFFAFMAASVPAQQKTGTGSSSDIQKSIQDRLNQYANALVNNDNATLEGFYTDDAISMPNYGKMLNGKNAIHKDNMDMSKNGGKINSLDLNLIKVLNEKGDLVNAIGNFKISFTTGKKQNMTDEGNFMTVFEKQKGEWKIKAEIWNTANNPWMNKGGMDNMNKMNKMNDNDMDDTTNNK